MANKWDVKQVRVQGGVEDDQLNLNDALNVGWEPFAVTGVRGDYTYHMKRERAIPRWNEGPSNEVF